MYNNFRSFLGSARGVDTFRVSGLLSNKVQLDCRLLPSIETSTLAALYLGLLEVLVAAGTVGQEAVEAGGGAQEVIEAHGYCIVAVSSSSVAVCYFVPLSVADYSLKDITITSSAAERRCSVGVEESVFLIEARAVQKSMTIYQNSS